MRNKNCFCDVCRIRSSSVSQYPTIPSTCQNKSFIGETKHIECKNITNANIETMNKLNNALTAESFFNDKNLNLKTLNRIRKALGISTKQIGGSNNKNPNKATVLSFFIDYAQKIGWDVLKEKLSSKLSSSMETQD